MKKIMVYFRRVFIFICCLVLLAGLVRNGYGLDLWGNDKPGETLPDNVKKSRAVFITCSEMVDEGLYESIKRRTENAIDAGAEYIIYEMDTFGGRVDSAIEIYNYLMLDINDQVHTAAYVRTKAISAGALISVACEDIIMKANTKLGDCAPIMMGGTLEGVEREKMESPLRTYFEDAANTNGYPAALCKSMVTVGIEVVQIKNNTTSQYEYFEADDLPEEMSNYDEESKKTVVSNEELLTVHADKAMEYGLCRAIVHGLDKEAKGQVLKYFEERDSVKFGGPIVTMDTNWSEQMVRWVTSPAVSGILMMIAILGVYAELNSPGVGLPGAVAVAAFIILFGSKFLIGMANWWEIAMFVTGLFLLMAEIFLIPGFGIAGIGGSFMMFVALVAMTVTNRPDEWPMPITDMDWEMFEKQMYGLLGGFIGFVVLAVYLGKYLHKLPMANRLILTTDELDESVRGGNEMGYTHEIRVNVGDEGVTTCPLRPCGIGRFNGERIEIVSRGEMIDQKARVKIVEIEGNRIVVSEIN